MPIITLVESVM